MKKIKILIIFLIFTATSPLLAYSDAEVRKEIQAYIDTQKFPQKLDEITHLTEILTSTRGIVYLYEIKLRRDEFPLSTIDSIKERTISTLCDNSLLAWYKNNNVDMSYVYFDNREDMISLFKINSKDC